MYGAYELQAHSMVHGGTRLVGCLFRCMVMALALTAGWQIFGHNLAAEYLPAGDTGAVASLPPSYRCKPFSDTPHGWLLVFAVYNFPIITFCAVGLNVRPRDIWQPMVVAYPTLLAFGALSFQCTKDDCQLPGPIIDFI